MGCLELVIDPEWAWEPRKGFLGLPRELRDTIYNMVLIETPKWERRHSPLCDKCPKDTSTFERPVFDDDQNSTCKCKKRQNTGLLLANRQIHGETAPIFWSQNKFCFSTAKQFCDDVGVNLRNEYQPLIQDLSILCISWQDYQYRWFTYHEHMYMDSGPETPWPALFVCKGLKTLEIMPEFIFRPSSADEDDFEEEEEEDKYDYAHLVPSIKEELPLLEEFSLAKIFVYDVNPKTSKVDRRVYYWDLPQVQERDLVYVKAKKALDMDKLTTGEKVKEHLRSFNTNFAVHVKFALETTLLGVPVRLFSTNPAEPYSAGHRLVAGFDDSNTSTSLKLRDGTTTKVQLLGLPISQQTRIVHVKERWREDARRKAAGKPTVWQEKYKSVVQERQDAKRVQRFETASKEHQAYVEARETKRVEAEAYEQKQRRKTKATEKKMLARSERQALEIRTVERKRVKSPK